MKTSTALKKLSTATALAAISACTLAISKVQAQISEVDYDTLNTPPLPGFINFDDQFPDASDPGIIINNVWSYDGANFAERFIGQTLTYNGDFDVLSNTATGPLSSQVGLTNQNLYVYLRVEGVVITGVGPKGADKLPTDPDLPNDAVGEGAISVLFNRDQSKLGFKISGTNGGKATVQFFKRNGNLIGSPFTLDLSPASSFIYGYGFQTDDGSVQIAGVSIYNNDPEGINFDDFIYDKPGDPPQQDVPEPNSVLGIIAISALGVGLRLKRKLTGKNSANRKVETSV